VINLLSILRSSRQAWLGGLAGFEVAYLELADIDACLGYAALRVDDEELVLSAA
jgi:hypothetical protein